MQIKTTLRFRLIPVRMAKIKKLRWQQMLVRMWRKRNTPPLLVGLQACTTTLEISLMVPQKTGHSTTWGPSYTTSGHIPKCASTYNKDTYSTMFIETLFIITPRRWKQPRCPSTEEWIQRMWYVYPMEYYSAVKNIDFIKFTDKWMELENILSEVTQLQKNTHGMYSLISVC